MVIYFLILFVLFAAQITLAWRLSFFGVSPDFIFSFFAAAFLPLKDKRLVWFLAIFAGFLASIYSPLPAPAHIAAFLISGAVLFSAFKIFSETVQKPLILAAILPLAAIHEISILAANRFANFLGFGGTEIALSAALSRKFIWQIVLNFACALVFYFLIEFFRKRFKTQNTK